MGKDSTASVQRCNSSTCLLVVAFPREAAVLGLGQVSPPFPLAKSAQVGGVTYLKVSSVFDCYFVSCLGFLETCAFTALFEADILVDFVDSFIHMVADASLPDRKGLCLREQPCAGARHLFTGELTAPAFEPWPAVTAVGVSARHTGTSIVTGIF